MSAPLDSIHTLYVGELSGEPGFGRQLVRALVRKGWFELTEDRSLADAVLEAHSEDTDESFIGDLLIRDLRGSLLWSARSERPHGAAGPMAYEQLLADLADALPELREHHFSA